MKTGCPFGTHRVIEPQGVLPQTAFKIDNNMEIYDNEILIDVQTLNIDSASSTQISEQAGHDKAKVAEIMKGIVAERGKHQNPVTGSGGMLIGTVKQIGTNFSFEGKTPLKVGDKIATLVSLSLTPLVIDEIIEIKDTDQVDIKGKAILFQSGLYAKLPSDMPEKLALSALDVAGAPAQVAKLVKPGDYVLLLGGAGKSGILCCYEAKKRAGITGKVIALVRAGAAAEVLKKTGFCDIIIEGDATKPVEVMEEVLKATGGRYVDVAINMVNVPNTEMATILPVRDDGIVYLFSMATSFTKAALGAEGVGKDVTMIIGNGYTKGHDEITLQIIRENETIRKIFEELYA